LLGEVEKVLDLETEAHLHGCRELGGHLHAHRKSDFIEQIDRRLDLRDDRRGAGDLAGDLCVQELADTGVEIGNRVDAEVELDAVVDLRIGGYRDLRIAAGLAPIICCVAAGRKQVLIELRRNCRLLASRRWTMTARVGNRLWQLLELILSSPA
jgi:hypothetical protein